MKLKTFEDEDSLPFHGWHWQERGKVGRRRQPRKRGKTNIFPRVFRSPVEPVIMNNLWMARKSDNDNKASLLFYFRPIPNGGLWL
jgi:hypothetical protein